MSAHQSPTQVSIVIPALNEWESLDLLAPRLGSVIAGETAYQFTVLLILSKEATHQELERARQLDFIGIARRGSNSFGDAVRTGIQNLPEQSELVIFMDADGSHPPETISRLLQYAEAYDVVIASRYTSGGSTDNGPILTLMSRFLNFAYRLVLGVDCKDVSTSYKLYRAEDLRSVVLSCRDFDIVEEILIRVSQLHSESGMRIKEVPDHFSERVAGESKRRLGPFIASYLITLYRLRRQQRRLISE